MTTWMQQLNTLKRRGGGVGDDNENDEGVSGDANDGGGKQESNSGM